MIGPMETVVPLLVVLAMAAWAFGPHLELGAERYAATACGFTLAL